MHEFHFRTQLLGPIVSIEAFEVRNGSPDGYNFQQIGNPEDDLLILLGALIQKIRRTIAIKYIQLGSYGLQIIDKTVKGRITSDLDAHVRTPLFVIDGKEITWDKLGDMIMAFEGWQFKLEFAGRSDEI